MVRVVHSRSANISGVDMERSGEEGFPKEGSLVGESELSRTRSEAERESRMSCLLPWDQTVAANGGEIRKWLEFGIGCELCLLKSCYEDVLGMKEG